MRRFTFTTLTSIVVFALVPPSALARHHGRHHHGRHHHSQAHVHVFGSMPSGTTGTGSPMPPAAGTVQSFDPATGRLVIALNGGSTVSGTVTNETELECEAPENAGLHEDGDHGGTSGGDGGNDNCTAANLTPGATVQEAELRISSAGSIWERVVLEVQNANS